MPPLDLAVLFGFRDRPLQTAARADTLLVEPDLRRFTVTWRARAALGRRLDDLREVVVGPPPRRRVDHGDKPHYPGLGALARSNRRGA